MSSKQDLKTKADDALANALKTAKDRKQEYAIGLDGTTITAKPSYTLEDMQKIYAANRLIALLPEAIKEGEASVIGWIRAFADVSSEVIGTRPVPYNKMAIYHPLKTQYKTTAELPIDMFAHAQTTPVPKVLGPCIIANALTELQEDLNFTASTLRSAEVYERLSDSNNREAWLDRLDTRYTPQRGTAR